jgi:hypothetical protein
MERRRFKQIESLEARLAEEAKRLREEAKLLPPGAVREEILRRARQAETGSHISEWLSSPGLQPPKHRSKTERITGIHRDEALRTTPGIAPGVTDRVWTIEDLIDAVLPLEPNRKIRVSRNFTVIEGGKN